MVALTKSRLLLVYVVISVALVGAITLLQYFRYDLFGTDLLLGWDSPRYVWAANVIMAKGSLFLINTCNYPHLYVQLLAFLGYLIGNVVIIERILPLAFCTLLIYANASITLRISKNIHIAGLAAILTAISVNTLRLYADLNRNLMVLSLSFTSFLLISDFVDQNPFSGKSLLSKTYLSIIAIFLVVAGTQLETFLVLALTSVLVGIVSRSGRKLAALALIPAIPTAILLVAFPQLPLKYISQMGLFSRALYLDDILLWTGGSWILLGFLVAGATYLLYRAIKQRNTLASAIFSWTIITVFLFVLTMQRIIPLSMDYALRALLVLPVPVLCVSVVSAFGNLLKDTFLEIGMSSSVKRYAFRIGLKHVALITTAVILITSSVAVTSQHYDEFVTPYVSGSAYRKIQTACDFLKENGFQKPIVVFYGYDADLYGNLYNSYFGAEIGEHYCYRGDVGYLLRPFAASQYLEQVEFASPLVLITPYLYDKEVLYCLMPYHIGQGVYVIPPWSKVLTSAYYGPAVAVTEDDGVREIKSEYLYAYQDDPSIIVIRVATVGSTSYTFQDYPSNWAFLKLEQGGVLSFPEVDPRRFDGRSAVGGNDPAESTQDWNTVQAATTNTASGLQKEGLACLKVEGVVDSWGNLGCRYDSAGTWDFSAESFLSVWAKASEKAGFSVTLTDSVGNTRTFWDLQPGGSPASTQWKRFAVSLSDYTDQTAAFDISEVNCVDFYVSSAPGTKMSLWVDDVIIDGDPTLGVAFHKARVAPEDLIVLYFWARCD